MNPNSSSRPRPRRGWFRWVSPAAALSGAAATLLIWFEEVVVFVTEFIGVIFLPILASLIYFFNVYVFKSAMPKADEPKK
jgi:hypothetical protein